MAQHALNHRRHLRGGAAFDLRIDAGSLLFEMPVDHDTWSPVADMPFGEQILIPGGEFLGIRSAGRRRLAPDLRMPDAQERIDHFPNRRPQRLPGNEATPHIQEISILLSLFTSTHMLEACVGAQRKETEQQAFLQRDGVELLIGRGTVEQPGKAHAQIGLLEHVQQAH